MLRVLLASTIYWTLFGALAAIACLGPATRSLTHEQVISDLQVFPQAMEAWAIFGGVSLYLRWRLSAETQHPAGLRIAEVVCTLSSLVIGVFFAVELAPLYVHGTGLVLRPLAARLPLSCASAWYAMTLTGKSVQKMNGRKRAKLAEEGRGQRGN